MRNIMNNWFKWVPSACLALLIVILLPICFAFAVGTEDPEEAYDEYKDIKKQIEAEEDRLKGIRQQKKGVLRELNDVDKDILYLNSRIENIENDLRIKKAQMTELERQLGEAMTDLEEAQHQFEGRLVEWYKDGTQQDISFLLSAGDLSDFIYRLYYTEKILEEDINIIGEIKDQKSELFSARDNLNLEIDEVNSLKSDLSGYRRDYQSLYGKKKNVLDQVAGNEKDAEDAIDELEQESIDIASFLRGIEGSAFYPVEGKFDHTFAKPLNGRISSGFGMRVHPILHRRKMHTGIDIAASTGTPIKASGGGQVVFSGWKNGYGKTIIIDHGSGLATLYAHCSQLLAPNGDYVKEGQVIAKVGSTGFSTGPHCHFEIRKNGDPKDPMDYLNW